jgi:hypothetical protein
MRISGYACDICATTKGETNHWLLLHPQPLVFMLSVWSEEAAEGIQHLCGSECAGKALDRWMKSQSVERKAEAVVE